MSPEELETLEVKSDAKLMRAIVQGLEDAKAGRVYSHDEVFKRK